jgi:hypothetical protein
MVRNHEAIALAGIKHRKGRHTLDCKNVFPGDCLMLIPDFNENLFVGKA